MASEQNVGCAEIKCQTDSGILKPKIGLCNTKILYSHNQLYDGPYCMFNGCMRLQGCSLISRFSWD